MKKIVQIDVEELGKRNAIASQTGMASALLTSEKNVIDRLMMFSQQHADMAADDTDGLAPFHSGISFGYWASARAICAERKLGLEETARICGAHTPNPTKKGA